MDVRSNTVRLLLIDLVRRQLCFEGHRHAPEYWSEDNSISNAFSFGWSQVFICPNIKHRL